jgi:hypothetical protein
MAGPWVYGAGYGKSCCRSDHLNWLVVDSSLKLLLLSWAGASSILLHTPAKAHSGFATSDRSLPPKPWPERAPQHLTLQTPVLPLSLDKESGMTSGDSARHAPQCYSLYLRYS